jgi:hypothetical protein
MGKRFVKFLSCRGTFNLSTYKAKFGYHVLEIFHVNFWALKPLRVCMCNIYLIMGVECFEHHPD